MLLLFLKATLSPNPATCSKLFWHRLSSNTGTQSRKTRTVEELTLSGMCHAIKSTHGIFALSQDGFGNGRKVVSISRYNESNVMALSIHRLPVCD